MSFDNETYRALEQFVLAVGADIDKVLKIEIDGEEGAIKVTSKLHHPKTAGLTASERLTTVTVPHYFKIDRKAAA